MRDSSTSPSLIRRLCREETRDAAWQEFVARYGRLLYQWGRQGGLQSCDAEDVAQETLLMILRLIRESPFEPRTTLRGWMHAIARRTWSQMLEQRQRTQPQSSAEAFARLASLEARDDLIRRFDDLARRELFEQAQGLVRQRVEPTTWQAFALTCLEHRGADEVARSLGLSLEALYMARSRVKAMLRQTLRVLDHDA